MPSVSPSFQGGARPLCLRWQGGRAATWPKVSPSSQGPTPGRTRFGDGSKPGAAPNPGARCAGAGQQGPLGAVRPKRCPERFPPLPGGTEVRPGARTASGARLKELQVFLFFGFFFLIWFQSSCFFLPGVIGISCGWRGGEGGGTTDHPVAVRSRLGVLKLIILFPVYFPEEVIA